MFYNHAQHINGPNLQAWLAPSKQDMYICIYIVESTKKARGHTQKANLEKAAYPVAVV